MQYCNFQFYFAILLVLFCISQYVIPVCMFQILNPNLKYTKKHEWIQIKGNQGVIGITDYAQGFRALLLAKVKLLVIPPGLENCLLGSFSENKLGEIVYAELPTVGQKLEQSAQFATLESIKAVREFYLPSSGKVVAVNEALKDNPSAINKSPFDDGWLIKIDLGNKAELDKLLNEKQYNEFLKSEH